VDFDARPITEEEKKMIEAARRREYERQRRGDGKERSDRSDRGERSERSERSDKDKSSRPSRKMDIIDQLDATSIYGTGRTFYPILPPCSLDDLLIRCSVPSRWAF
jgi:hypothetical protein